LGREEELTREVSYQKRTEVSKLLAASYNKYDILKYVKLDNGSSTQNIGGVRDVRRTMKPLREV